MTYAPTLSGDLELELPEFDSPPADPIGLLNDWISTAEAAGVREPRVVTLSTADAAGRVSARTVLIKDIDADGILIGLAEHSRKGRDLLSNPRAAITFYWRERGQQILITGAARRADGPTSDRVFSGRPRSAQALASISEQSRVMDDPDGLRAAVARVANGTEEIRRPASWVAWVIAIDEIEFFHGAPDRFHRRLRYVKDHDRFRVERLQP